MTLIFTDGQIIRYAETRLFGDTSSPDNTKKIELHNGDLPSMLEIELSGSRPFVRVSQENGREPIYFQDGTLYISQSSGVGRARRYKRMIEEYIRASKRDIAFEICDARNRYGERDPRQTNINYDNFAYDFTMGLYLPEPEYKSRRIFGSADNPIDVASIEKLIFGSVDAMAKQAGVIAEGDSEYLDCQILEIGNKMVLNIGYVYSDQAGRLLDNILREFDALAKRSGDDKRLNIYMFGRVGDLKGGLQRNHLVYPTEIINDRDIYGDDLSNRGEFVYPIHNILAREGKITGRDLNISGSVLDETRELLQIAVEKEAICSDMELKEVVESINKARGRYPKSSTAFDYPGLDISFGFVGYVSDLPLQGDTLADEMGDDTGEQAAVREIILDIAAKIDSPKKR